VQASVGEAAAARDKVSRELEAARQALKEQFREMQNSQDAAMAAQQQVRCHACMCPILVGFGLEGSYPPVVSAPPPPNAHTHTLSPALR